jgi:hypothetical protein
VAGDPRTRHAGTDFGTGKFGPRFQERSDNHDLKIMTTHKLPGEGAQAIFTSQSLRQEREQVAMASRSQSSYRLQP